MYILVCPMYTLSEDIFPLFIFHIFLRTKTKIVSLLIYLKIIIYLLRHLERARKRERDYRGNELYSK